MSYRVDIPTLSANEVYTLTFEYEGTETIQLIVGDLTLETTDRRVVFTTTSPVNYIESNVNLTNLNIYEGYYESDDFGGEYTQESIIEGKSLINYHDFNRCIFTVNNETQGKWEFLDDGFARMTTLDVIYNHCRPKPTNYTSEGIYTVATWVRNFNSEAGNVMFECFHYLDVIKTINLDGSTITGNGSGTHHYSTGQEGLMISVGKYGDMTHHIPSGEYHQYMGNFGTNGAFVSGDNVEIFVMVLEGDKADDILNGLIQPFHGIGCVKSPRVISREQPLNMFYCTNWTSTLNNGTVTCQDGKFYFDGNFYGYTWFDIINGGEVKNNIYLEPGSYHSKIKAHSKEPCASNGTCVSVEATMENGETIDLGSVYTSKDAMYNGVTAQNKEFTSPIVKLTLKIWYGGNGSNNIIIDGVYLSKTDTTNDLAFKESHVVSTPDDLELHGLSDVQDTLDLTDGLVTKKIGKLTNCHELISGHSYSEDGGYYTARLSWRNVQNINTKGNQTLALCNVLRDGSYKPNTIWSHGIDEAYYLHFGDCTTLEEAQQYCLDNNLTILYELKEPITEQLSTSLNPLKSYYNGSIQTSSQQLAPTLKTTLPISNKFTTTNLTSGSTYNVYFDGTATKLDAGGTIITNPISPCEVECGGTTLTIEGTDIQNVRVIETTVKNEVGSVNGTTDVELSKIKTKCGIHNIFDDYFQGSHNTSWAKDENCTSTRDDTTVKVIGKGFGYAGYSLVESLPFGTYKLHYKVKISTIGDKYKVVLSSNPNGQPQDAYVPVTDVTSTALVEEQTFVFYKKHITNMLFYTYTNGQEIEYYDISLIKLSDEDITGTDTSSINYSQSISILEQPIKLRSLGTTYDSYNPVTGELVKRIGVSETDGSYSVLSSPIVENIAMGEQIINLVNKTPTDTTASNVTFEGNAIKVSGGYGVFLLPEMKPLTTYTAFVEYITNGRFIVVEGTNENGYPVSNNGNQTAGTKLAFNFTPRSNSASNYALVIYNNTTLRIMIVEGTYSNYDDLPYFEGVTYKQVTPYLYTNGQVKIYSDSEVYPTTILNGQSTNNYEINELNTSNNYTIRYDGECESINLANKSNEQGTNRIIKSGATSGNLTFVNDSGDIDNVLLVQNDVREQKIKHFNGLQTVEVSRILIENQRNMSSQHYIFENGSHYDYQRILPHYIKVEPNETLYANIGQNWMDWCTIYQYDEDKNRLSDIKVFGGYGTTQFKDSDGLYKNIITLSDNTRYIRIVLHNGFTSTFTLSRGDFLPPSTLAYNQYQGQYIDLPQPVQLNSLPDGTCDTYNPITGEYVQNVGIAIMDENGRYGNNWSNTGTAYPVSECTGFTIGDMATRNSTVTNVLNNVHSANHGTAKDYEVKLCGFGNGSADYRPVIDCGNLLTGGKNNVDGLKAYLKENPIILYYQLVTPITTQLTPITIPTFEGGIVQLITTDGKVFPMIEYSMPTNNRYDTSSWETGKVYTQRNMTEAYFNESTTPMIPTETMTLTTDHISSGSIILNDNGNGLIVLKGNYTGRDIPYFTGMRSVEAIEVETTPSPDQPLFGKGGRK